ncbi:DEAD/DEAH box helicase [Aliamphritea spongicola]|uniref:DEAD/DEAH box helicase n=1 Tax=Aliamphritea spongicola TaxID=707589 RepID=UPI00196B3B78|nr:DEAD/DEAH box helicase [Aliamphritea spongicola]MBN3561656.1 DEAD/DEAH box helicase [Aliamphritea spongicola]
MSFAKLGLSDNLLATLEAQNFTTATPVQQQAIPLILQGKDVLAAAQTGTGKTAAFALPILHIIGNRQAEAHRPLALILVPTRELASQVAANIEQLSNNSARSIILIGGVSREPQLEALQDGAEILIATPGRLLDLYLQDAIRFDHLELLVLDEADRMLDLGFSPEITRIFEALPARRQTLLFSATFSDSIRQLARQRLNNPAEVSVSPANSAAKTVKHWLYSTDKKRKAELLTELILTERWRQTLVFTKTKKGADALGRTLADAGINCAVIHSDRNQQARDKALNSFQAGRVWVLIATDVASRGLDIDQLKQVVNFDLPVQAEDYIHRIGRTGRAGKQGQAISLVSADEFPQLQAIEQLLGNNIERREVAGFEADHRLPLFSKPAVQKKTKDKSPAGKQHKTSHQKQSAAKNKSAKKHGNAEQHNVSRKKATQGKSGKPRAVKQPTGIKDSAEKKPQKVPKRPRPSFSK